MRIGRLVAAVASLLVAATAASAQSSRRASATTPAPAPPGRFDPFADPNTNPFISPLAAATQEPGDRTTTLLSLIAARRHYQGLERRSRDEQGRPAAPPVAAERRPIFGSGMPSHFGGGVPGWYFGRQDRYHPTAR